MIVFFCVTVSKAQTLNEQIQIFKQEQESLEEKLITTKNQLDSLKLLKVIEDLNTVGLPKSDFKDEVITHSAMILGYAEEFEQARWVAHIITPDIVQTSFGRSNDFREDEKVSTGSATQEDYFLIDTLENGKLKYDGFGYDRGHLAPSADFRWSEKTLSDPFLYSNMSPQKAGIDDPTLKVYFDESYEKAKTKMVQFQNRKYKTSMCPVIIEGKSESLAFAWNVGVGSNTGMGFGALR